MARFLIELPHESESQACARFVKLMLTSGSHFLTHADWGCQDGIHNGWIVVEVGSKEEARNILPPPFRRQARVVALNYFTVEQMDEILNSHRT
ncbi:MAG TPA: hypothetical protein VFO11_04435 [Candidatus Polarisedimenticolaceae bacterium]|nr:hypothetical protein [Candidatus Polarisedimenticolaceae bacterium]